MKLEQTESPRRNAGGVALARLLLGVAMAAGLTGCEHYDLRAMAPTSASSRSSSNGATAAIPLPGRTPFDDDSTLRAIYLQSYGEGYGLAVTNAEYASPGCLCEANGDPRKYDAMADGFFAGRKAGAEAYRARQAATRKGQLD